MLLSGIFSRILYGMLCVLFFTAVSINTFVNWHPVVSTLVGIGLGLSFSTIVMVIESFLKNTSLRSLNVITLGLFFGALLGKAVTLTLVGALEFIAVPLSNTSLGFIEAGIYLFSTYLGLVFTHRASNEIYISVPFIKFKPVEEKKRDILLDESILSDPRLIDLATSGLLDNHLVIPRFIIKSTYIALESGTDSEKGKARRVLEIINKLESIQHLNLRIVDTDFPEVKGNHNKLIRLARVLGANILSAETNQIEQLSSDDIRVIFLNSLSKALKPITMTGEIINIKVQRYGKEARQGVGYLDDGTMVVINGGADYIGEAIKAQVLSVKHTSSGRMIFCNALGDEEYIPQGEPPHSHSEASPKNYFAL